MLKKRLAFIIVAIFILFIFSLYWMFSYRTPIDSATLPIMPSATTEMTSIDTLEMECIAYEHFTSDFTVVTTSDLNEKIDNEESFFLYTGRITCEWCRKFVPVLNKIAINNEIDIFYLDSELTESDPQLKAFREKYNIDFVPSLIYFDATGIVHNIEHEVSSDNFSEEQLEEKILIYF